MSYDYDYIIIGSGFGGSVSALRLAEKGYRVLVIEKGKWYKSSDFAKTNWNLRKWMWMPRLRFFGIMKLTIFRHIAILSGTGVGGGSLVFANTLPIPKKAFYKSGSWCDLADWETELKPYYLKALSMLGASRNPQFFDGDKALETLAEKTGKIKEFNSPLVSVFFGNPGEKVADPYFDGKGPPRAGCNFCGGCMTGCRFNAKNTLDKNYLFLAQKLGVKILAEHEAYLVQPLDGIKGSTGYQVKAKSSTSWFKQSESFTTRGVIFSGGVLGTLKLLLKLKQKFLPRLSNQLGKDIRTNNETLISVSSLDPNKDFSKGVAIGSILHTDGNSHLEVVRYGAGSGFWKLLHLPLADGNHTVTRLINIIKKVLCSPLKYFQIYFLNSWSKRTAVLLFMQTLDSTLQFKLSRFGKMRTTSGNGAQPSALISESRELTRQFSHIVNGKPTSFILETLAGIPSTAHILGGAIMGASTHTGVINKQNEVFGYQNMYVVDGSMISANPGVNPALTITAIAERAMAYIPDKK